MPGPSTAPCPWCAAPPGSLFVSTVWLVQPVGSYSLAGMQLKAPASQRPVLACRACHRTMTGTWDDERHVSFDRNGTVDERTAEQIAELEATALQE